MADIATGPVARLIFHGWKTSLALVLAGMLISFLLFGFFWPYWRIADQDLILAYQGLLFNDRLPQEYFDHTGYLNFLLIGSWYRVLHWVGLLPVHAVSELPPAANAAAFDAAFQRIVVAGRVLSLLLAGAFVATFASLVRRIVEDWRIAILAALALAWSGGVVMHLRVMRTELLSGVLVTTALLVIILAAREARGDRRLLLIGVAGLCASLAVVAKLQALFPALAIPVLALAFGQVAPATSRPAVSWRVILAAALGLAAIVPAALLFWHGVFSAGQAAVGYRNIGGGLAGIYQGLIVVWVLAAMAAYAALWRVSAAETIAAAFSLAAGISVGLLSLHLRYHEFNVLAVAHPVEHMFAFASASVPALSGEAHILSGTLFTTLMKGLGEALAAHTFVLRTSPRPTLLLEWFAIAGTVVAWRRGDRRLPLQVGLLIATAWGLDAVSSLRGLKLEYFAYSDPLLILAAVLVYARFPELQTSLRAQRLTFALFVVYVAWAHAEPVKKTLSRRAPQEDCSWFPQLVARVQFPFCRS